MLKSVNVSEFPPFVFVKLNFAPSSSFGSVLNKSA